MDKKIYYIIGAIVLIVVAIALIRTPRSDAPATGTKIEKSKTPAVDPNEPEVEAAE